MVRWALKLISSADGAEEFAYLMNQCLIHYGSAICNGMYDHVKSLDDNTHVLEPAHSDHVTQDMTPSQQAAGVNQTATQDSQQNPRAQLAAGPSCSNKSAPRPAVDDERVTKRIKSFASSGNSPQEAQGQDEAELHLREQINGMRVDLEEQASVLEFSSIAGLEGVKLALEEFACFFLHFPHLTRNLRQRATTGILLFGPQGTGKTLIVRSFAKRYGMALYDIRASAIMSKFVGESEKFIRTLFSEIRANAPAIILLDECDGLLCDPTADAMQSHNYRLLQNEIKNQWSDLIQSRDEVIVIGATNKPHDIDMDGFGRRLSLKLRVDLPSAEGCQVILEEALGRLRHRLEPEDFSALGFLCHEKGLSGYDIDVLVEALLRRAIRNITVTNHFFRMPWEEGLIVVPCAADDPGAMQGSWRSVSVDEPEAVSYRPFAFSELEAAISKSKATVDHSMRQKHAAFAAQYSTE